MGRPLKLSDLDRKEIREWVVERTRIDLEITMLQVKLQELWDKRRALSNTSLAQKYGISSPNMIAIIAKGRWNWEDNGHGSGHRVISS